MTCQEVVEIVTALATLGLAGFTWRLAAQTKRLADQTVRLADEAKDSAQRQLGVQTWLEFEKRFDSIEIQRARVALADKMPYDPTKYEKIKDDLPNLFESIAIAYNQGVLHENLAACSFSYYASHWYAALEPYINEYRRKKQADGSFYVEFQKFAEKMQILEKPITDASLADFLKEERQLRFGEIDHPSLRSRA
jgi:hypothetical protein